MLKSFLDWAVLPETLPLLVIVFIMGIYANSYIERYIRNHAEVFPDTPFSVLLRAVRGMPRLWCIIAACYWVLHVINLSDSVEWLLYCILFTLLVFSITRVIARVSDRLIEIYTAGAIKDTSSSSLLTNLVAVAVYACGVVFVLSYYGISIAPIITTLGVGGMALALGLQEMLANIFAGLHLLVSKQIRVGDHIRLSSGEEGMVTDITWRYTTVRTVAKNNVIVPNKTMAAATITNYDLPQEELALTIPVGVSYDSDLEKVEAVTLEVACQVTGWTEETAFAKPLVRFTDFADSAITFNVILYLPHYADQSMIRHAFIKALTLRYREESINIPYPVRTILNAVP